MTNLFKIGTTDLTKWDYTANHKVNKADVYQNWTDGNWVEHREIVRTRITGTVELRFSRAAEFTAFLALLTSERNANGYYTVTVYCSDSGTTETIDAFLEYAGETKWDVTCPRVWQGGTVTIYQR